MPLPIEAARIAALHKLAVDRFGIIHPAEAGVLAQSASTEDQPPASDASRPTIRAAFLRWLAADKDAAEFIDPLGLRARRAIVSSDLNLDFCRIPFPLRLTDSVLEGSLSLQSAEVLALDLSGCTAEKEILGNKLSTGGDVNLRGLCAFATASFAGAQIAGDLNCGGACLRATGVSLNTDGAKIDGNLFLGDGFSSAGTIRLAFAQIGGDLNCPGARLTASDLALHGYGARIRGGVFLRDGFCSSGVVRFPLMQTGGDFDCSGAERFGMLRGENMRVDGRIILTSLAQPGALELKLDGAIAGEYHDDAKSWPSQGKLHIDGFVYKDIVLHTTASPQQRERHDQGDGILLDPATRICWLKLQPKDEIGGAQPWMQLAQLLEADGNPGGAKHVVYEYRRQQAKEQTWLVRPLSWAYDNVEEEPLRISIPMLGLWALGTLVFWRADRVQAMTPTTGEANERTGELGVKHVPAQPFQPGIYALENVLPVVKLGQDSAWAPDAEAAENTWLPESQNVRRWWSKWAWLRWIARLNYRRLAIVRWALILLGWAMALILGAAIADAFRR